MSVVLTVLLSFVVVLVAVAAMAIGAIAGGEPIKGSCGGVGGGGCDLCSGRCKKTADR